MHKFLAILGVVASLALITWATHTLCTDVLAFDWSSVEQVVPVPNESLTMVSDGSGTDHSARYEWTR